MSREEILEKISNKKHSLVGKYVGDKLITLWLSEIEDCFEGGQDE